MQYKGSKRIRRVAAVILSAALMVSELPNTGLSYVVSATESTIQENEQVQEMESQHIEESSQPEEQSSAVESQETEKQTEDISDVPESSESAGTETPSETESIIEEETETESETETKTVSVTKEPELVKAPTVDTGVYEYEKAEFVTDHVSGTSSDGIQLLGSSEGIVINTISNKDEFKEFIQASSTYSGETVKLACDIDLNGETVSFAGEFKGTFDGQGHSISNFKTGKGLFQTIGSGATVQNLHLSKVSFDGTSSTGVVTADNFGTISYVTVTGTLTATTGMSHSAGIAAKNESGATISNCVFAGTLKAQGVTETSRLQGGIVAENKGTISDCYAYGTMVADIAACSGIAAENGSIINHCANYMSISGCYNAAGIVAKNSYQVTDCINYGDITQNDNTVSNAQTGGVVAENTVSGSINKCYNYATVKSETNNAAGIAGVNVGAISGSGNFGNVSGHGNVAGIAGQSQTGIAGQSQTGVGKTIDKCFNVGIITGNVGTGIGGIVGGSALKFTTVITNCYNRGSIKGNPNTDGVGGIAGILENGSISKCYNAGAIPAIENKCVGNIAGLLMSSVTAADYYYQSGSGVTPDYYVKNVGGDAESKITGDRALDADLLKVSVTSLGFVTDSETINAGYPIISGQRGNTKDYLIVYELNGGCSDQYFKVIPNGGTIEAPTTDPTKNGATFKGWFADESLSTSYGFGAVTASAKVYAGWTESVRVTDFSFPQTSVTLVKGETFTIPVVFTPENADNKTLTWTSNNESAVTVDNTGKLTAVNAGTATITARMADNSLAKELKFTVTVTDAKNVIRIMTADSDKTQVEIKDLDVSINDPVDIEAVVGGTTTGTVTWDSTDKTVATVTPKTGNTKILATIKALKTGKTTISATLNGEGVTPVVATLDVTVRPQATEIVIKLDDDPVTGKTAIYDLVTNKFVAIGKEKDNRLKNPVADLSASVLPSAANQKVEWTSDNESVIKFADKESGAVTANSNGTANITASATDGSKVTATVAVEALKVVQSLELEPKEISSATPVTTDARGRIVLTTGGKIKLVPKYNPADATNQSVTWSISDKSALTIDSSTFEVTAGDVTKDTEVTVKARSLDLGPNGDGAECTVTFIIKPKVTGIKIYRAEDLKNDVNNKNIGVNPANKEELVFDLVAKNDPENASQIVTWKTSNKEIADVVDNKNGSCQITASGKEGTAVITATAADGSGVTAKTTVNVTGLVSRIIIKGSTSVVAGKSITLTAEVEPKSVKNKTVTWSSLQPNTASVDPKTGKVTGKNAGFATIIAKANDGSNVTATHGVNVTAPIEKFRIVKNGDDGSDVKNSLNGKSIGIDPDTSANTYQLGVYVYPDKACQDVTWKSSNEKVATVDETTGLVTAVALGKATITATSTDGSGKAASVNLNVTTLSKSVKVEGSHYVAPEKSIQLTATVGDKDALNKNVNWSSSDEGVLTVDKKGKVTVVKGKKAGSAIIRAEAADGSGVYADHKVIIKGAKDKVDLVSYDNAISIKKDNNKNKYVELDIKDKEEYTVMLTADLEGTGGDEVKDLTWTSSSTKLATVTSDIINGKSVATVKLLGEGNVKITATTTDGYESKDTITFKVVNTNPFVKITGPAQVGSGKRIQLSAGKTAIGEWESSDPSIATVNSRGQVSAKRNAIGTVTITARAKVGTNSDTYTVKVAAPVTKVDIRLDGSVVTGKKLGMDLINGYNNTKTMQFMADVVGGDSVTWKSSNTKIATIDENGKVEALKTGKVTITATATDGSGKKASVTLTVAKQVTEIVAADTQDVRVALKKSVQLAVSFRPYAATTKKVTWSVAPEDKDYVSVNGSGKVTAKKQFSSPDQYATVIASAADDSGKTYAFKIYITNPVDKVEIVKEGCAYSPTVGIDVDINDAKITLTTNLKDKAGAAVNNQGVTWKSSNTKIAKIDENGVVTGLATGQVTITATAKDGTKKSGKVNLYVGKLVTSVTIDDDLYTNTDINHLNKGRKIDLSKYLIINPSTATKQTLTYTSSNKNIVTVDSKGKITSKGVYKDKKSGITYNTATITISTTDGSNIKQTVTVTVTN